MITIHIYDTFTGVITRKISCPLSMAVDQLQDGEEFYLNCPKGATHIIDNEPQTIEPDPPPKQSIESRTIMFKLERNALLAYCDWTQMPDSPLTVEKKAQWATYRQQLRDYPSVCTDIYNPVWPSPPLPVA